MDDVTQAILVVVLKGDSKAPDPINLTWSFERFTFAVDHPDVVPSDFAIKHFNDICRGEAGPKLHHLEMLKSHLNYIALIINGRDWVRTHTKNNVGKDWPNPAAHEGWRKWVREHFKW
jgi:hypothetical protein